MTGFEHRTGSNRPAYFDEYRAAFVPLAVEPEVVDCPRCGGDHWLDLGDCVCRHVTVRETSFAGSYTGRRCLVCSAALPDRSWDS